MTVTKFITSLFFTGSFALALSNALGIKSAQANEITHKFSGYAVLRYENETKLTNKPNRERMRLIARAGITSTWSPHWQSTVRLGTGLKNKQNVPAITIKRFSAQPQPDNDIFVEQAFAQYSNKGTQLRVGKLPWLLYNVTDTFWDRDLKPVGLTLKRNISEQQKLVAAAVMPLDGHSGTIGQMLLVQYQQQLTLNKLSITAAPWIAAFNGQTGADFAKRDTEFNHVSARLSVAAKYQSWQLGIDAGLALSPPDKTNKQNVSMVTELRYGNLKAPGNWLLQGGYSHVERYAVIREFGQNARAGAITTNYSGWDIRLRYKLTKTAWLGTRFSRLQSLYGPSLSSNRFRIETRWAF